MLDRSVDPRRAAALLVLLAATAAPSLAQVSAVAYPAPQNVIVLDASATTEVANDWLTVVFGTTREGSDASAVQSQLRQALDAALAEARKAARPGQVEVRTGNFSLYPRQAPRTGGLAGWQGSAELIVEGRDTAAIVQLGGRIQTMTVSRVGFSLSREAREKVEGELTAEAIARFRAKADAVTREFGQGAWSVREVQVSGGGPPGGVPVYRTQMARAASADEALPVEAGRATVSVTVSGSVQMSPR
jgi:predicted secreted protein